VKPALGEWQRAHAMRAGLDISSKKICFPNSSMGESFGPIGGSGERADSDEHHDDGSHE
jgi:hypothetical protein